MTNRKYEKGLIIFIKNPEKGKVKTRIAKTMGDETALRIYHYLSDCTRKLALSLSGFRVYLYYSDAVDVQDDWSNELFIKKKQYGNDLGERMANAFNDVLPRCKQAVIIGSDCPTLTREIIHTAFEELKTHDFTIGPATDGGYYLLGIKQSSAPYAYLFKNMEWSVSSVLEKTIARIDYYKQTYFLTPPLTDIDKAEDWKEFNQTTPVQL